LIFKDRAPTAALVSSGVGVVSTLLMTAFLSDAAGLAGFAISLALYLALRPKRKII